MKVGQTIYLDHQATTPVDPRVVAEMAPYFEDSFGNPHSKDHSIGWTASLAVDMSSDRIAALIGADKDEIIFTSGATESNNLALLGLCRKNTDKKRHRVLLSAIEHKSVLAVGRVLETQLGYDVQLLPVNRSGCVEMATLESALDDHVLVVSIMAVNNEIGTIQDLGSLAKTIRDAGAFLHCDAAQTPLAIDIALFADGIDMISLSSHKMGGPKGIGALYVRRDLQKQIEPLIYGGGQQNGLRSGTVPVALCVGMGAASSLCRSSEAVNERRK
ncbi:MAG: cysteine desulfurase family protein, partial [Acidobacteriota bacterium]